jgi:nucleoside-triphosphate--adenylate kinase
MPLSLVINLDVPDSIILERISERWTHLPSGRIYNMSYNRPKVDGLDDITGEKLVRRPDDNLVSYCASLPSPLLKCMAL